LQEFGSTTGDNKGGDPLKQKLLTYDDPDLIDLEKADQ
jgi:hypothetical protein